MSAWSDLPAAAGEKLGLPPHANRKIAFGVRDGFLVQVEIAKMGNAEVVQETVRFMDAARDEAVRQALPQSAELAGKKIKAKAVTVKDGAAVYRHAKAMFSTPSPEAIAGEVDALVSAVKLAGPPPAAQCRVCGGAGGVDPILVNGLVDRVCPGCVERLQHEAKKAAEEYEKRPLNLPFALVTAAVLAVIGALAWAGLTIATNKMYWLVAIGVGALIGVGTAKAAGKGGLPVQVIGAVFTVASVLLGQVLITAWFVSQTAKKLGGTVDWGKFISNIPDILVEGGSDTVFALAGGLLGAYFAAKAATKPKHEVKVEKA
jgi:hypothetical protein